MIFKENNIRKPLYIESGKSKIHGRGVFAKEYFKPGAIIEKAPLILLDHTERENLQNTLLFDYYFLLNDKNFPVALALGMASLYNHAVNPNASYSILLKNKVMVLKAICAINAGDEITINYHGKPGDTTEVYFSRK